MIFNIISSFWNFWVLLYSFTYGSVQFSSVAQSCLTLYNPRDWGWPGFPVHHQLPEPIQTHGHWVGDAIQPSHPLSSPSPPAFNLSQHQGLFKCQLFASGGQSIGVSASASVLLMNIQDWFPLGWTGWISLQSNGLKSLLQHHSSKASILRCSVLLYSPTLTSIHDHWKNHSLDQTDLCWQSNVSNT